MTDARGGGAASGEGIETLPETQAPAALCYP